MNRQRVIAVLPPALLCVLVAAGCHRTHEPVAKLTLSEKQFDLPHGRMVPVELRWEPSKPLPELAKGVSAPVAFVHLIDAQGNVVRTFDHPLPGRWQVGGTIADRVALYHSAIGPALPAGDYRLTVGLYDGKDKRFALTLDGEELKRQEYVVAHVKVPDVAATGPAFTFSPQWLAVEPGGDRQAVARRWLNGDGTLEARALPAPARVWLLLRIPEAEPPLRMMLEPGATLPSVKVSADCGAGFSADVAGVGFHEVAVPVRAQAPCTIAFDTNYVVVEMGTGRKLSLGVEQLGWEPGDGAVPPQVVP
ncbi:MAG TPA: hypothetical protein VGS57_13645 [Thermoanaerobaculia bacterium]|jgi:hypothetical protein|nr:hypothetical protein [Thermoanaerobaculia bacterium]